MKGLRFIDLFAGLGGFHVALSKLGHECVFASEIDDELRSLYEKNFKSMSGRIHGDIRKWKHLVPEHDFLCAGFPCQPFSKSGAQLGILDETRGTLFHEILEILERLQPRFVLLENVGNFGRHDDGRTWKIVKDRLSQLGYFVAGTEHLTPASDKDWRDLGRSKSKNESHRRVLEGSNERGSGLISPHHFGFPHHRERFYIYASLDPLPETPFPSLNRVNKTTLTDIVMESRELSNEDRVETMLSVQQSECIQHWNQLIKGLPVEIEPPSFPMWGDELDAMYPFLKVSPWAMSPGDLGQCFDPPFPKYTRKEELMKYLPSYAREEVDAFRQWKIRYIQQNREWWEKVNPYLSNAWKSKLKSFPPSLRKLEWNVKGEARDLWSHVLQFRPSGLRVKRYSSSPALVAMTSTQIPILGPEKRFLTRIEGRRLQGFPDDHNLPVSRVGAFKALGNAVHVGVVEKLAKRLIEISSPSEANSHNKEPLPKLMANS
jgi:DNA (cytosine-5)-methyltransferase 1